MVASDAPALAPDVAAVPVYAAAATGRWRWVRGYTGVVVSGPDDEVFATLCGVTSTVHDDRLVDATALMRVMAGLLSELVIAQHAPSAGADLLRTVRLIARTDGLTGLLNRYGWDHALLREARRSPEDGGVTAVVVIDLDELKRVNDEQGHASGDGLLRATADVLMGVSRPGDAVARSGGDEFAVLVTVVDPAAVDGLVLRIGGELARAGIAASVGGSARGLGEPLSDTWARADSAMLGQKRRWRADRVVIPPDPVASHPHPGRDGTGPQ